ncbi:schwannomin-interacting protein 1 homolog isoform X2 [Lucilia cuprina]|uniref:schwannomin-interacting protein 1 homolog isoform X2 n=1 Tax=Lucilia cuprina TaxID=7375 RepID=UPI001F052DF2|nr:schwannomin-interacting protein 1 homolog isoform X2 [Lucilia cuprina]
MRVPDISATAGYAATVFNPLNNQRENHSTNSLILTALGSGHNKFDNTPITGTTNNYFRETTSTTPTANTVVASAANATTAATTTTITNYASSADEFIQKALNSTPTEYSPPILNHLNDNNIVPHYCCGALPKTLVNPFEDCYDKDANNTGNTYKSFKEIFNTNKSFYEDCLLKNGSDDHVTDTDLDPIELINSRETPNSNTDCGGKHVCTNPFDVAFSQYNAAHCKKIEGEKLEQIDDKSEDLLETEKVESGFEPDDNDYDDHSMIDLCSDTKSIYDSDEKEDDFLTSASSSSGSLHTPKHSFFPRGIINPNYPGFQHLAHTLSEHFITSSPSDSYESDMSEYEMELSADSFESLNEEKSQIQLNTYNNNTPEKIMNPSEQHNNLEFIENAEAEDDIYLMECSKGHRPSLDEDTNRNSNTNQQQFNIADLQDHLKNTLTLLEKQECALQNHNNMQPVSITPDILIKNYNLHVQPLNKKENRPDLLRGVSPHLVPERKYHEAKNANLKLEKPHGANCYGMRSTEIKDEMSFGLTPVDIIGDFGQEVEREFGLLVSGYRRLVDTQDMMPLPMDEGEKISDAVLSVAKDQIDTNKYLEALNKQQTDNEDADKISPELADDNAVDLPLSTHNSPQNNLTKVHMQTNSSPQPSPKSDTRSKPKYQKSSYDDRQLPPVAIEYKRCQQTSRSNKKSQPNHIEKSAKVVKNTHSKPSIASRLFHPKRNSNKSDGISSRKREEAELNQYQQLISDKEQILSNSKYAKLSSWAQYLKNSVNERGSRGSTDLISPSALELFDAYKIGTEVDMEQLQQHLKMAKEIEKKRRSDREEIRRRLAMGAEENCNELQQQQQTQPERNLWKPSIQSRLQSDFTRITEISSDTESHSSDSETCPKLSKSKSQVGVFPFNGSQISITDNQQLHPYHGRPLSVSCSNASNLNNNNTTTKTLTTQQQQLQQQLSETFSNEDRECDFFTKQAKLQIEARMALSQAKEMAHMQMEIERQNQRVSPITAIIRDSLDKVGVQIKPDKRRLSRQLLTDMNIAQLQILVNNLHTRIEELNESLVNYLMERDDLHDSQDTMLVDIEELTRYIGAKEHIAQQERISSSVNKCSK